MLHALLQTLAIAILGTFISAIICVPFAFWAARNISKNYWVSGLGKAVLSCIRVFPELIMALIFIKAVGLGPFAGILALGFHSVGMLGKLFGESIENTEFNAREALIALVRIEFRHFGLLLFLRLCRRLCPIRSIVLKLVSVQLRFLEL